MIVSGVEFDQASQVQDLEAFVSLNELSQSSIYGFAFGSESAELFRFAKQSVVNQKVCGHTSFYTMRCVDQSHSEEQPGGHEDIVCYKPLSVSSCTKGFADFDQTIPDGSASGITAHYAIYGCEGPPCSRPHQRDEAPDTI